MTDGTPQSDGSAQPAPNDPAEDAQVVYSVSPTLMAFLATHDLSICLSSYQSGRFYMLGRNPEGGIMINEQVFEKAMGIDVKDGSITLATLFQIHRFENVLRPDQRIERLFDACYVPRKSYTTGVLDAHDVAVTDDDRIVFVNTRFNCLATISDKHSFEPVWTPSFISKIADEDRCHLNGLALEGGQPAYVTAVSKSDTIDGWRDRRRGGGLVIDVRTDQIVCEGLSMPHSPRVHRGELYVLESGSGRLGRIVRDAGTGVGTFEEIAFCPGFARGLAFHEGFALVGLSKPRYERFEGLPLDAKLTETDSEAWCGLQIINLQKKEVVAWFRIDGTVQELYDIAVLPKVACGMSLSFVTDHIKSLITYEGQ
ncbi:TIGR03032 family protein [Ruegeria sp. HKCCD8929]|uniref:TIGR03032 family protein n=1 Tax=Ruegeria sp. HKCCD8929 TaxID=2683006 RepID=UPI00148932BA|nr:TIGR03032 family protein [Ruegeria sp. HKCCD8929]